MRCSDPCTIRIYPFVKESVDGNDFTQSLSLLPQNSGASRKEPRAIAVNPCDAFHFNGWDQDEAIVSEEDLASHPLNLRDQWSFIIAIHLNSPKESAIQSLFVYCAARVVNGSPKIKVITQKCQIQNRGFFISEMYGLGDLSKSDNESKECVICMTNPRDTCVLPCRHVCCCAECANTLRLQSDKCPVCRKPITELVYLTVNPDYLNVQKGADGSRNVEMQSLWL
ncbi:hypothetical protein WA577_000390 [Blastocystis sp. JDR]